MEILGGEMLIIISIILNVVLITIFKLYKKYRVDTLSAIVVNYVTCYLTAWIVIGKFPFDKAIVHQPWFLFSIFLGALFVIIFNLTAITTQKLGIAKTVVYQKMSMIAPVILGLVIFKESISSLKILGIITSIVAIFLLSGIKSKRPNQKRTFRRTAELYGIFTFLGSCIIDGMLYVLEEMSIVNNANIQFVAHLFLFAGIFGTILIGLKIYLGRTVKFRMKEIIAGVCLGIPNFFTIYLILKILDLGWDGSVFFPINNVGILALAAVVGIFLFRERLSKANMIGLATAVLSIYLLAA